MFEGIMSKIRPRTAQELRDGETSGEKLKTRTQEKAGKEDASPKTGKCKKCGAVLSAEVVKRISLSARSAAGISGSALTEGS